MAHQPEAASEAVVPSPASPISTAVDYPAGDEPRPYSPWLWLAILAILGIALPFVPIANLWAARLGALALAAIYVIVIVRFSSDATRRAIPAAIHVAFLLGVLALWWLFEFQLKGAVSAPLRAIFQAAREAKQASPQPTPAQLLPIVLVGTLTDIFLLSAAVLGGSLVARLITEANMLAPVCGLIAIIDVWGVLFGGFVAQMLEKAPSVSAKAMASLPTIGAATNTPRAFQIPLPDIGAGDYLFLGLLFAALHAHRMNVRGAMKLIIPLVILALWAITLGASAMPGLLFIGLGAAIPNRAWFRFSRDEKFALLWAGGFVAVLAIALGFGAKHLVAQAEKLEPQSASQQRTPASN
ncbi:MAG TPA: hypothetical protein VF681_13610 [Abditibacteriaceae bacterium]|jgi:hypothetical protein